MRLKQLVISPHEVYWWFSQPLHSRRFNAQCYETVKLSLVIFFSSLSVLWLACRAGYLLFNWLRLRTEHHELVSIHTQPHNEICFCFELGSRWEAHPRSGSPSWLGEPTELSCYPLQSDSSGVRQIALHIISSYHTLGRLDSSIDRVGGVLLSWYGPLASTSLQIASAGSEHHGRKRRSQPVD